MRLTDVGGPRRIGRAVVSISTHRTRGLAIGVWRADSHPFEAEPFAVMRYANLSPGRVVPEHHRARRAHACWAGTNKRRATLRMHMIGLETVTYFGERGRTFFPVMRQGVRTVGRSEETFRRSVLATQDIGSLC